MGMYIMKANENQQLECGKFIGTPEKNCIQKTYSRSEKSCVRTQCKFMKHSVVLSLKENIRDLRVQLVVVRSIPAASTQFCLLRYFNLEKISLRS